MLGYHGNTATAHFHMLYLPVLMRYFPVFLRLPLGLTTAVLQNEKSNSTFRAIFKGTQRLSTVVSTVVSHLQALLWCFHLAIFSDYKGFYRFSCSL